MKFSYIIFLLALNSSVFAQIFPGGNIPVFENGVSMENPWAGGLDLPQFSSADINYDDLKDLIIFDKRGNKWLIYLNLGNSKYKYVPQYEPLYPEVINLGLIRDFNCDDNGDIFAHTNFGIQVFRNTHEDGNPSFVLEKSILRYTADFGSNIIYKFNGDIPAIEDFDGDGDMDVLSFDILGTTIPYYQNLSVENGYDCDSLIFEENTVCWGHFKESSSDNSIDLNFLCKGNKPSNDTQLASRHTGSTLLAFDEDNDGDKDLLLGDVSTKKLIYLENGGTNLLANMISIDTAFPSYNTPVDLAIHPSSFYVDIDNDNKEDLLISPNAKTSSVNNKNVWYYKNTGNSNQKFSLQQDDFLVETQIDLGSNSFATFFDHNADGLLDMIVSNGFIYNQNGTTSASLYYYENTGTASNPEFTLINPDYQNITSHNWEFMRPTFGDLDDDGDQDMIVGEINGKIHYYDNIAGATNDANFVLSSLDFFNIDIGTNSHPQLIDLNEDGLLDLIIGRNAPFGNVAYYKNIGSATNPVFHQDTVNPSLGNIHVESEGFLSGHSAPFVTEKDLLGNRYIYVGSEVGYIHYYRINEDSLDSGTFVELQNDIFEVKIGSRSTISLIDINNDGEQDYFIGNSRGGVHFYSDIITDTTLVLKLQNLYNDFNFNVYPNPTNNFITIKLNNNNREKLNIQFFNITGKEVFNDIFKSNKIVLNLSHLPKAVYFLKVSNKNNSFTKKIILD